MLIWNQNLWQFACNTENDNYHEKKSYISKLSSIDVLYNNQHNLNGITFQHDSSIGIQMNRRIFLPFRRSTWQTAFCPELAGGLTHSTRAWCFSCSLRLFLSNGSAQNAAFWASDEHRQHWMAEAVEIIFQLVICIWATQKCIWKSNWL